MRKVLFDTPLDARVISDLLVHDDARGFIHQFRFTGERCGMSWLADVYDRAKGQVGVHSNGKLEAPDGHRLRLTIAVEPEPQHAHIIDEKELGAARNNLVEHMETTIAVAIERLIAARIARALRVHCDADHSDET